MNPIALCALLVFFAFSLAIPAVGADEPLVLPVWPGKVPGDYGEIGALKRVGIPTEMHVCATGERGFGVRRKGEPTGAWTEACVAWLRGLRMLEPGRVSARVPAKRVDG